MLKPGQVIEEFKSKKGNLVKLRVPQKGDEKALMNMINSIIVEDDFITVDKKLTLKEETEWLESTINKINSSEKLIIIAEVDGNIVGNTGVDRLRGRMSHIGIFGISIISDYREEGIGTRLAQTVISNAKKELKLKSLELEAYASNSRAINLYKKLGFLEFGRLPNKFFANKKYVDSIYMYKEL